MILLWGVPGDGPLDAVAGALRDLGVPWRLLDQRDARHCRVSARVARRRLRLRVRGLPAPRGGVCEPFERGAVDFDDVDALYLRPVDTERALAADGAPTPALLRNAQVVEQAIVEWADSTPALILNRPSAMAVNNSKPYQLRDIARHGFEVPPTLVTTDPRAVRAFAARHARLVYKSVSGVRSIVNVLDEARLDHLGDVANAPTQFQAWVPGHDVRVHVVGDEVFAAEIRSRAHDYRYASRSDESVEMAPIELEAGLAARCRTMAHAMHLPLAGIDLRRTPDGRWFCFEVNPSPAFVYYEAAIGQPIGAAIARLLATSAASLSTPTTASSSPPASPAGRTAPSRPGGPPCPPGRSSSAASRRRT